MWNPERGLADRSCFFFALFSGCRLRSDRMLFLSHLKWRVTMSNTIKGDTITITIKVIMAYTISHHPSHPDQSHPQSSMAAPAEEAAQLLRVKRYIFYMILKVSKKFQKCFYPDHWWSPGRRVATSWTVAIQTPRSGDSCFSHFSAQSALREASKMPGPMGNKVEKTKNKK